MFYIDQTYQKKNRADPELSLLQAAKGSTLVAVLLGSHTTLGAICTGYLPMTITTPYTVTGGKYICSQATTDINAGPFNVANYATLRSDHNLKANADFSLYLNGKFISNAFLIINKNFTNSGKLTTTAGTRIYGQFNSTSFVYNDGGYFENNNIAQLKGGYFVNRTKGILATRKGQFDNSSRLSNDATSYIRNRSVFNNEVLGKIINYGVIYNLDGYFYNQGVIYNNPGGKINIIDGTLDNKLKSKIHNEGNVYLKLGTKLKNDGQITNNNMLENRSTSFTNGPEGVIANGKILNNKSIMHNEGEVNNGYIFNNYTSRQ